MLSLLEYLPITIHFSKTTDIDVLLKLNSVSFLMEKYLDYQG